MAELLVTLGLMIMVGAALALIARKFHQPILLGYVLAGFIIGPAILGLVKDAESVSFITEFGLIFLLFIIGLELDLSKMRDVGKLSAIIGSAQVIVCTLVAAGASTLFGFTFVQGLYLGLVVAFSSTLVVIKILTDIKEIDSLHGELALGILVIQDVFAVIGLSLLGALGGGAHSPFAFFTILQKALHIDITQLAATVGVPAGVVSGGLLLANIALFAIATYLFMRYVMTAVFKEAVHSGELLFVVTLGVVFILSAIAGFFELSLAMGAFLAGIALSTASYSHEIVGRVKPLKDFFLILFFVGLGMQIGIDNFGSQVVVMVLLVAGALVLKPIVIFFLLKLFKYNNRTAFLVSLHLAQVGEFGMVLIASGAIAFASSPVLTGVVIITIVTMTLTAYAIKYDEQLYQFAKPFIAPLDHVFGTRPEEHRNVPEKYQPQVIIFGVNSTTAEAIETLHAKKRILVVDYNPSKILSYKERGIPTICSDATNLDVYEMVDLSKTEIVVSVIHQPQGNLFVLKAVQELASKHKTRIATIMTASTEDWGKKLYRAGATLVLIPDLMGRRMLAEVLAADDPVTIRNVGKAYFDELHKNFVYIREI